MNYYFITVLCVDTLCAVFLALLHVWFTQRIRLIRRANSPEFKAQILKRAQSRMKSLDRLNDELDEWHEELDRWHGEIDGWCGEKKMPRMPQMPRSNR